MEKTYWSLFGVVVCGLVASVALIILVLIITVKGLLRKRYCMGITIALALIIAISAYHFMLCIKDYSLVINNKYIEDSAVVVEFTHVYKDLDGNGKVQYSKPRFYIESKNKYIVLNVSNVEIGKEYKIRYYPNTKICEIVNCIE